MVRAFVAGRSLLVVVVASRLLFYGVEASGETAWFTGIRAPVLPPGWQSAQPSALDPPDVVSLPKVREASSPSPAAADVASHIARTFGGDPALAAHEDTHQANADLANRYRARYGGNVIGLYLWRGTGVIIVQPPLRLSQVAAAIPASWRGSTYDLYLIRQQRPPPGAGPYVVGHEDSPLYVLDEWRAYTKGLVAGLEVGQAATSDLLQSLEFLGYALALLDLVARQAPTYDALQLQRYVAWQARLTMDLYSYVRQRAPGILSAEVEECLRRLRTSPDGERVRETIRGIYGVEWCRQVLGF